MGNIFSTVLEAEVINEKNILDERIEPELKSKRDIQKM